MNDYICLLSLLKVAHILAVPQEVLESYLFPTLNRNYNFILKFYFVPKNTWEN